MKEPYAWSPLEPWGGRVRGRDELLVWVGSVL